MVFQQHPYDYGHIGDTLEKLEKAILKDSKNKELLETAKSDIVHLLNSIKGHEEKTVEAIIESDPRLLDYIRASFGIYPKIKDFLENSVRDISRKYTPKDAQQVKGHIEKNPLYTEDEYNKILENIESAQEYWRVMKKGSSSSWPRVNEKLNNSK